MDCELRSTREDPLVSIIVPSYNHVHYIEKCILSILNQSYRNFELTVIDDGSNDGSPELLATLALKYGFRAIFQENRGVAHTLNRGIKEFSKGSYISFCASDDYWCENKLKIQVQFLESHPKIPMCYGKNYVVDEIDNSLPKRTTARNYGLRGGWIFDDLLLCRFHPPVNYMFRKCVFDEVGLYREGIYTEDFYMNLRIARKYKIGYIDEYLAYYREPSGSALVFKYPHTEKAHMLCINEYRDSYCYQEALEYFHLRSFFQYSDKRKYKKQAINHAVHALTKLTCKKYIYSLFRLVFYWK